jgi:HPt (histidine-containing phosphotransfer) domain-containing protein
MSQDELNQVKKKITSLEDVADISPLTAEQQQKLTELKARKAELENQLQGQKGVNISGNVDGSVILGTVTIGSGDFTGRDKTTVIHSSGVKGSDLVQLIAQLQTELQKVPAAHQAQAEQVATEAKKLEEAVQNNDTKQISVTKEGLKKAAENLAAAAVTIGPIVAQIMAIVSQYVR